MEYRLPHRFLPSLKGRHSCKPISIRIPRDEDFKKSQDNILKRHTENLQENVYWLTTLDNYYFRGFNGETAYEETIKGITPAKIQAFAKKLLGQGNRIEVVMEP